MGDCFYENGLKFECQRCSFCCGHGPGFVYLSRKDLEMLCIHFGLTPLEFVKKYGRWVTYYEGKMVLALKEEKNYDCVLWDKGCSAYESRPVQCRTYPFWAWMIQDKRTWDECGADCPGINRGRVWSKEEIIRCREEAEYNIPITIEEFEEIKNNKLDKGK